MDKTTIFLSTSLKGGVGKSTVAANVAFQLAKAGASVLLCDLDFDVRSLDLIMGYEDALMFDISDVIAGRCKYSDAVITDKRTENLYFLGAPYKFSQDLSSEDLANGIKKIAEENPLDFIILDTSGADTLTLQSALRASSEALVIACHTPASLRGAQKSAELCENAGVRPRLIVNNFDYSSVVGGKRLGMIDMIDTTKVPLLGVIPYDDRLIYAQERGILAQDDNFISKKAFENIASRILADTTGQRYVPILKGVKKINRRKILTK